MIGVPVGLLQEFPPGPLVEARAAFADQLGSVLPVAVRRPSLPAALSAQRGREEEPFAEQKKLPSSLLLPPTLLFV